MARRKLYYLCVYFHGFTTKATRQLFNLGRWFFPFPQPMYLFYFLSSQANNSCIVQDYHCVSDAPLSSF